MRFPRAFFVQHKFSLRAARHRLLWKILLIFWLGTLSTVLVNIYITQKIAVSEHKLDELEIMANRLGEEARAVYDASGRRALRRWQRNLTREHGFRVALIDVDGSPLRFSSDRKHNERGRSRPLAESPDGSDFFSELGWSAEAEKNAVRERIDESLRSKRLETSDGTVFFLQLLPSKRVADYLIDKRKLVLSRLFISFIILFICSWLLARHIAAPLKQLRLASEAIAGGNLSERVADRVRRKDELGELAVAFDRMTDEIEQLVSGQKRLFRDISHDIKTPLTRQRLAISLARDRQTPQLLDQIEAQNNQINRMVDQLLLLFSVQEKRVTRLESINVSELLQRVIETARLELEEKHIQLKLNADSALVIEGGAFFLERAVSNLLANALHYTPNHSLIEIGARRYDNQTVAGKRQHPQVLIEVLDQGPGIEQDQLAELGKPFFRPDSSRTSKSGGHGLGLAIVREIAHRHHGELRLANRPEGGFSASIIIPSHYRTSC